MNFAKKGSFTVLFPLFSTIKKTLTNLSTIINFVKPTFEHTFPTYEGLNIVIPHEKLHTVTFHRAQVRK